jgi:hypothetical protein
MRLTAIRARVTTGLELLRAPVDGRTEGVLAGAETSVDARALAFLQSGHSFGGAEPKEKLL